jgi:hypothetical protein
VQVTGVQGGRDGGLDRRSWRSFRRFGDGFAEGRCRDSTHSNKPNHPRRGEWSVWFPFLPSSLEPPPFWRHIRTRTDPTALFLFAIDAHTQPHTHTRVRPHQQQPPPAHTHTLRPRPNNSTGFWRHNYPRSKSPIRRVMVCNHTYLLNRTPVCACACVCASCGPVCGVTSVDSRATHIQPHAHTHTRTHYCTCVHKAHTHAHTPTHPSRPHVRACAVRPHTPLPPFPPRGAHTHTSTHTPHPHPGPPYADV